MKKVAILISGLILCVVIVIYFYYINNRVQYPLISDSAFKINYYDETDYNKGNHIDKGVKITYTSGHTSNDIRLVFDNYKPYKRLEMYENEGVFIIIYDEEDKGERKDRLFTVIGFPGYQSNSFGAPKFNIEIYRNGKRVKDVNVTYAEE